MKKLFLAALATIMLTGCGKEGYDWGSKDQQQDGYGQVTLSLSEGNTVMVKSDPVTVTIDDEAELNNYTLTATNTDANATTKTIAAWHNKQFGNITDADKTVTIAAGTYKVTAESCTAEAAEEGRGKPRFYGEKNVAVDAGAQTPASVMCTLANAKVTVGYAASMNTYFTDYNVSITCSYTAKENSTRAAVNFEKSSSHYVLDQSGQPTSEINTTTDAFFSIPSTGNQTIYVTVSATKKGATQPTTYEAQSITLGAKQWYKITVGTTITDQGQAKLTLEVDGNVTVLEQTVNVNPY